MKEISIGLLLGDLYAEKRAVNARLQFEQGIVHEGYLRHLYDDLFSNYCMSSPKIANRLPDKRTGLVHSRISFKTYSLPCFNELYNLFYVDGSKVVPLNIGDLLTPLGLAYWICDDGNFDKTNRCIILSTNSFSFDEVQLLVSVLADKFGLKCTINKQGSAFRIRISRKSLAELQNLLKDIMPKAMMHKIGL